MTYLIETKFCIYIMNRRPPDVFQWFRTMEVGEVGISSITVSELQYGVSRSSHETEYRQRLEAFLTPFDILPYDEVASRCYGDIRADLERQGCIIGPLDLLIAAHALSRDLVLVTNNQKEFERIKSLQVENWGG